MAECRWHFQHQQWVYDSPDSATSQIQSGIVRIKNEVRLCIWLVERRSPITWVLSSYTRECPTKRASLVEKYMCSVAQSVLSTDFAQCLAYFAKRWFFLDMDDLQSSSIPQEMHIGLSSASFEIVPAPPWVQNFVTVADGVRVGSSCVVFQPNPWRCGVLPACCCGSGTLSLYGRCGVLAADCCGSGQFSIADVADKSLTSWRTVDSVRDGRFSVPGADCCGSSISSRSGRCGVTNATCCGKGISAMTLRRPWSQLLRQRQVIYAKALRRPWPTLAAVVIQTVKTLRRLLCQLLRQRQSYAGPAKLLASKFHVTSFRAIWLQHFHLSVRQRFFLSQKPLQKSSLCRCCVAQHCRIWELALFHTRDGYKIQEVPAPPPHTCWRVRRA